jgi:integrase
MGLYRRKGDGTQLFWCSYTIAGKRVRESTGTANKGDAEKFLAKRITGQTVPIKASIGALLDNLITDYEINGQDVNWCKIYVEKHIRPSFGHIKAERIDKPTINIFIKSMLDAEYKNATINRCIALLRRAFTLGEVPFPRIEKLQENNVRTGFVDDAQFFALYEKLPEHQRPVALFAYETGCRRGEVLKLKWSQIDFIHKVVRLNPGETKNKDGRVIPLSDMMLWFLEKKVPRISEYIFTYRGKPMRSLKQGWNEAQSESSDKILFHDLRRSAVRNMVRSGVPERVAMAVSGHRTRSVFDRYNVVNEDDLKSAMQKIRSHTVFMYDPTKAPELLEYDQTTRIEMNPVQSFSETGIDPNIRRQIQRPRARKTDVPIPVPPGLDSEQ